MNGAGFVVTPYLTPKVGQLIIQCTKCNRHNCTLYTVHTAVQWTQYRQFSRVLTVESCHVSVSSVGQRVHTGEGTVIIVTLNLRLHSTTEQYLVVHCSSKSQYCRVC